MSCKCKCTGATSDKGNKGDKGNQGLFGGYSNRWLFNDAVTSSPATKTFRLNNADPSLATVIYVHKNNASSIDLTLFLASFTNSGRYGMIRIFDELDSTKFAYYILTNVALVGSIYTLTVTYVGYNGSFVLGNKTIISFTPAGQLVRTRGYDERTFSGATLTISNGAGNYNTEISVSTGSAGLATPSTGTYRIIAMLEYFKVTYASENPAGNLFVRIKVDSVTKATAMFSVNELITNVEGSLMTFWEGSVTAAQVIDIALFYQTTNTDEVVFINSGVARLSYEKLN